MQSKISPLAAVAAVVAFTAAPAFALDAHLVPVPSGAAAVESVEGVAGGEEAAAAAPDAGAAAALPAIPSGIPWPPRPPFPVPPAPPAAEAAADDTAAEVAASTNTLSTWCPEPTVFTWGSSTISVSAPTWVTLPLTDCPLSSTSSSSASSTETVAPVVPHGRPHPHPYPGPPGGEHEEGHSPEVASVAPIKPPAKTVSPVVPTHDVVIAGASKTQGFMLGVAAAALGLAVFGL